MVEIEQPIGEETQLFCSLAKRAALRVSSTCSFVGTFTTTSCSTTSLRVDTLAWCTMSSRSRSAHISLAGGWFWSSDCTLISASFPRSFTSISIATVTAVGGLLVVAEAALVMEVAAWSAGALDLGLEVLDVGYGVGQQRRLVHARHVGHHRAERVEAVVELLAALPLRFDVSREPLPGLRPRFLGRRRSTVIPPSESECSESTDDERPAPSFLTAGEGNATAASAAPAVGDTSLGPSDKTALAWCTRTQLSPMRGAELKHAAGDRQARQGLDPVELGLAAPVAPARLEGMRAGQPQGLQRAVDPRGDRPAPHERPAERHDVEPLGIIDGIGAGLICGVATTGPAVGEAAGAAEVAVAEGEDAMVGGGAPEDGVGPPLGAGLEEALQPALELCGGRRLVEGEGGGG
ncbi:hypothetical protein C4D60_Mb01t13410 [Musa balbisiana]|uniref:Uncharacterized protein n=1 Tax=Musa balbisiana TaxID=52838 RepID=A0A4S8JLZ4_MUSBA|nr:hypothetical protein C4D60_Mb01t13410 [Musa balbisiana]